MASRPVLAEDGSGIGLEGLTITPESSAVLEAAARTYSWLTDQTIEDLVGRHAVVDLDARLNDAEAGVQEGFDELAAGLGAQGIEINVNVRNDTVLSSLEIQPNGLLVQLCAGADIDARIHVLEF